ncbi:unnamed protein product [Linum trigynum]|uniref:Uncharacterized protein n=1 Tax=Linum trigynum TaxID=586398 RepID=A0AAV2GK47_9ROSI
MLRLPEIIFGKVGRQRVEGGEMEEHISVADDPKLRIRRASPPCFLKHRSWLPTGDSDGETESGRWGLGRAGGWCGPARVAVGESGRGVSRLEMEGGRAEDGVAGGGSHKGNGFCGGGHKAEGEGFFQF